MPKHIPEEIKLKAMRMYLKGDKSAKQIADELSINGVVVSPPTIYAWAKKDSWGDQKAVAIADQQQQIAESEGQRFARMQSEQLDSYSQIAGQAAEDLKGLQFDRALDAALAADIGIKGQREVLQGMINMEFVQDIMSVLIEEISDNETLQRIGIKLKAIEQKHRDI